MAAIVTAVGLAGGQAAQAQTVSSGAAPTNLVSFEFDGTATAITRTPEVDPGTMARFFPTDTACGLSCISPMIAAPGVVTVGEAEVMAFIAETVASSGGILIDGRSAEDRALGHIATSVNVPLSLMAPDSPFAGRILEALGARPAADGYDFSTALPLVVYDAGPLAPDAGALVMALIDAGYPAQKIKYYRGGMQMWVALGLSFEE